MLLLETISKAWNQSLWALMAIGMKFVITWNRIIVSLQTLTKNETDESISFPFLPLKLVISEKLPTSFQSALEQTLNLSRQTLQKLLKKDGKHFEIH